MCNIRIYWTWSQLWVLGCDCLLPGEGGDWMRTQDLCWWWQCTPLPPAVCGTIYTPATRMVTGCGHKIYVGDDNLASGDKNTQTSDRPDCLRSPHYLLSTVSVVSTVLYNIYSVDIYYLVSTIYCIRSIYTVLYNIYTVDICRGVFVAKVCVCQDLVAFSPKN